MNNAPPDMTYEELPPYWRRQIKKARRDAVRYRVERNRLRSILAAALTDQQQARWL